VIRADKRLAERRPDFTCWRSDGRASKIIFCRRDNLTSYPMGRPKGRCTTTLAGNVVPRTNRAPCSPETLWTITGAVISSPALKAIGEVEPFLAERDGDTEKVARLTAEAKWQDQINEMKLRALMRG
jgi:hypothetical protein